MIEGMTGCLGRIEEIKTMLRQPREGGVVSIAPHNMNAPAGAAKSASVDGAFSDYLFQQMNKTDSASASGSEDSQYGDLINQASSKYGVDSSLIKAVIRAESGSNPNAVSHAGAQGLMQLMPSTAKSLGVSNPFDPAQNIDAGTKYLKQQLERFGSESSAVAAYNAGPGAVAKYGGIPPYRETQNYVNKVLSYKDTFQ